MVNLVGLFIWGWNNQALHLGDQGPVSWMFRELFGPEKPVVKLQSACFETSPEIEDILLPYSWVSGVCYIAVG